MKNLFSIVLMGLFSVMLSAQEVKQARKNDVASQYTLKSNGDLFRTVGRNECQVTNNVKSFKISAHPNDVAMIYFEKENDLYLLKNGQNTGNCPKAEKSLLLSNVKKYTVVPNTNTKIVNIALSEAGQLGAWSNNTVLINENGVKNYIHNNCYGSEGKSFSSYVAFAIKYNGKVLKIRGGSNGRVEVTEDNDRYDDVQEFTRKNNVCESN